MFIRDVMTREVELASPTMNLGEAARLMRNDDIGILPVADDKGLVGMVTDRDVLIRGVAEDRDPADTEVREVMTDEVLYCYEDQPAEEVAANMGERQIRRLPVVDRDKQLVGIVSLADLPPAMDKGELGDALSKISEPASQQVESRS